MVSNTLHRSCLVAHLSLVFSLVFSGGASAGMNETQRSAMMERLDAFAVAMANQDETLLDFEAPSVMQEFAADWDRSIEQARALRKQLLETAKRTVRIIDFRIIGDPREFQTEAGEPYILVSSETTMVIPEPMNLKLENDVIGFLDAGIGTSKPLPLKRTSAISSRSFPNWLVPNLLP